MQGLLLLLAFVALFNLFFSPDYLLAEEGESSISSSQEPQEEGQSPLELKYMIRKVIDIDYKHIHYIEPTEANREKPTSETNIYQELQVKAEGKVGERISVDVDYDDTAPLTEQRKISLRYKGAENEFIQEVALGDLQLSLPGSEFTAYNKSMFGARAKAKLGNFYLTGIGSFTQAVPGVKTFTGRKTFQKIEIPDTGYISHKYYRLSLEGIELPLQYGSVEVYIDDKDPSNNQTSQYLTTGNVEVPNTPEYQGYFDRQYPGRDYLIDYSEGTIEFLRDIEDGFVIAICYKDKNGMRHPTSGYRIIKYGEVTNFDAITGEPLRNYPDDEPSFDDYELKNRYFLGSQDIERENFILKVLNLSGEDVSTDYDLDVDYQLGILTITDPADPPLKYPQEPFFEGPDIPDPYPPTSAHRYSIYAEYRHSVDVYFLQPNIIYHSDRIYLNDKLLTRDEDYIIDYSTGILTFIHPEEITEDTRIRAEYEYMPFAGGQAAILGGRLEYSPSDNFSLGYNFLSQASPSPSTVPSLSSSPASQQVMGLDARYDFAPKALKFGGKDIPVNISFSGEMARSFTNPNTFGKAMVEDFEASKISDELSMDEECWQISGSPREEFVQDNRDTVGISNEEIREDQINPSWSKEERKILVLNYDFSSPANWDSVVYPISSSGRDYSKMEYLEIWVKNRFEVAVHIDLGMVSEDADEDGVLDTEDVNSDGKLNPGEDTGIWIGDRLVGKGNGRLDTEDLDGDGILDTTERYASYNLEDYNYDEYKFTTSTGWAKYTIPLKDNAGWNVIGTLVKHLRLWIEKKSEENPQGSIKIALVAISGDKWEKTENLKVTAVNNLDNPDYEPFSDPAFRSYYEDMYGSITTDEGKPRKESCLCLDYSELSSEDEGWVQETFYKSYDYTDYEVLNFWLHGDEDEDNVRFYLRLGEDADENYYWVEVPIKKGWQRISIPLKELCRFGSPSFREIKQLRAGIMKDGASSGQKLYLNDVYLSGVREKEGYARRITFNTKVGDSLFLTTEYKKVDPSFRKLGETSSDQELILKDTKILLSLFDFLPISYNHRRQQTKTLSIGETDLSLKEEGEVVKDIQSYEASFCLPTWPKVTLRGENRLNDYVSQNEKEKNDIYLLSLSYEIPRATFSLLPSSVDTSYRLSRLEKFFPTPQKEEARSWEIKLPFKPSSHLSFQPTYSQTVAVQKEPEEIPISRGKTLSLSSETTFWHLSPRFSLKAGSKEDNFSSDNPSQRNLSTNFSSSLTLPFRMADFFPKISFFENMEFFSQYGRNRSCLYENTSYSLDFLSELGLKDIELDERSAKSLIKGENFSLSQKWRPLKFINIDNKYSYERQDKFTSGTPLFTHTTSWPDVELEFDLNDTPLMKGIFQRYCSDSLLTTGYIKKTIVQENISRKKMYQPSLIWRGTLRKPEGLTLSLKYNSTREEEEFYDRKGASRDISSHYELKADYFTFFPFLKKIPFLGRMINPKDKVHLNLNLSVDTEKSYLSSGEMDKDILQVNLSNSVEYKVQRYATLRFSLNGSYFSNKLTSGEDYYSCGGSVRVEIKF